MKVWRLTRGRHVASAFSGFGSALYGQRRNSKGVYVFYAASSMALAQLEHSVHVPRTLAPADLVSIAAVVPDDAIVTFDITALPPNWRHEPPPFELGAIGDRWIREATSLAIRLPSAVVPDDWNVLIDPQHSRFREIAVASPERVVFDLRLSRK